MEALPPPDMPTQDYTVVESPKKKAVIIVIIVVIVLLAGGVIWLVLSNDSGLPAGKAGAGAPSFDGAGAAAPGQGVFEHDKDGDGMTDGKELEMGTSDLEFDTDGDGLADVIELEIWKTNPTEVDSDGDGFADGYEVINGFNPRGPGRIESAQETNS